MMISALVFVGCAVNKPTTAEQNTQKHRYANRQTTSIKVRRETVLITVPSKGLCPNAATAPTRNNAQQATRRKNACSAAAI